VPSPTPPPASAGVRIDPQLIYAVPLALSLVIHYWWPIAGLPALVGAPAGLVSIALGFVLLVTAVRGFRAVGTTLQPWESTTALVTSGPFRFSRNPVYLGYTLLYLGVALWTRSVWSLALLPLVLAAMTRLVIRREERYLDARFGAAYRDYARRVRRWI